MDEACNLRIQRLELDVENHAVAIKEQGLMLNKITQLLAQIRWMAVGAIGFFVITKIGLVVAVQKLLGL